MDLVFEVLYNSSSMEMIDPFVCLLHYYLISNIDYKAPTITIVLENPH